MRPSPRPFRASAGLLTAVLAALLSVLLVSGALAPAEAASSAVTRKISARAGSVSALVRTGVVISGTLTRSPKGSAVKIQRLSGKKWVAVRTTRTTTAGGAYATRITLPAKAATYSFRAAAPAKGSLRTALSRAVKVTALTRVSADMGALPSTVAAGTSTTFFGTVLPFAAGTTVSIQRQSGARWATVATVKLNSTGNFSKGVAVTTAGAYRVYVPRVGLKAPALSPSVGVRTTPVISTTALPNGLRGRTYSVRLSTVGNATGAWKASPLPAGVVVNATTGVISGRPTATGSTAVKIQFTQTSTGFTAPARTLTLDVVEPPKPVIESTTLPAVNVGNPYLTTLKATGDPAGTWTAAPLPAGLHLDGTTGVISGTASGPAGTTQVTVNFTETGNPEPATAKVLTLTVNAAADPVIATASLPTGGVTQAYSATLVVSGVPAPPGTWTASPLPAGLTLNASTGVISGTPTAGGTTQVTIGFKQTSTGLQAATKTLALKVNGLPVITTTSLPTGVVSRAYAASLVADGNPAGVWTADPLPAGLTLNPATGVITGSPTGTGSTEVVVGFTETATGLSASRTLTLPVYEAPVITTASLPDGGVGKTYATTLTADGAPAGTWTASPLPAGLTLNPTTGLISGNPTTGGTTQVTLGFTRASTGVAATPVTLALKVNPLPVIATATLPNGRTSQGYTTTLTAVGNPAGTWAAANLPSWLSLNPNTGVLSGTAPAVLLGQTWTFTVVFTQTSTGLTSAPKELKVTVTLL